MNRKLKYLTLQSIDRIKNRDRKIEGLHLLLSTLSSENRKISLDRFEEIRDYSSDFNIRVFNRSEEDQISDLSSTQCQMGSFYSELLNPENRTMDGLYIAQYGLNVN